MELQQLFSTVFDCVFPPSEEARVVRELTHTDIAKLYMLRTTDGVRSLAPYGNSTIQALVHEAKFHHNRNAWVLLHTLFTTYYAQFEKPIDYLIPIPLSPARMRARGYNQVLEILNAGSRDMHPPVLSDVLIRIRNTRPQTELARKERLVNMHEAWDVVHGERITGKHVLLIDDVTTTGTTLNTAKAALLPHSPASITCVALAH